MIIDSYCIVGYCIYNIDYCFVFCQVIDVRFGKIIFGIKKSGCVIFCFFLFYYCCDICLIVNILFIICNLWYFIRFDMGMKIVGINYGDIFGVGLER